MVAAPRAPAARLSAASGAVPRRRLHASDVVALAAVVPLLTPIVSSGLRLARSDVVLATLSPAEAALSVRSPVGVWAIGLTLVWFALAYRSRDVELWEPLLVALGGLAALLRVGNAWLDGIALLLPLARQLRFLRLRRLASSTAAVVCVGIAAALVLLNRPGEVPAAAAATAATAARATPGTRVFTDWRWAPSLQRGLGGTHAVLGAAGLAGESADFWSDYARVSLGHERWADILRQRGVDMLVLDSTDQAAAAALVRASPDWRVLADVDGALVAQRTGT